MTALLFSKPGIVIIYQLLYRMLHCPPLHRHKVKSNGEGGVILTPKKEGDIWHIIITTISKHSLACQPSPPWHKSEKLTRLHSYNYVFILLVHMWWKEVWLRREEIIITYNAFLEIFSHPRSLKFTSVQNCSLKPRKDETMDSLEDILGGLDCILVIHVFVGHRLVTKVFVGKLPATRGVWVIVG